MRLLMILALLFLAFAAGCAASEPDETMHPEENLHAKCSPDNTGKKCALGIEMDYAYGAWYGLYSYDPTCTLLSMFDLKDALVKDFFNMPPNSRLPATLVIKHWQTGDPAVTVAEYWGHIEWCYWGVCYSSDLNPAQRFAPGGKQQCNCYMNSTVAETGMPCNHDLCCGCSWDCSALGGVIPKVGPRPSSTRAKGHFGEIVSKPHVKLNPPMLRTLGVSSSSTTHRSASHPSTSAGRHPASSRKAAPKSSGAS